MTPGTVVTFWYAKRLITATVIRTSERGVLVAPQDLNFPEMWMPADSVTAL